MDLPVYIYVYVKRGTDVTEQRHKNRLWHILRIGKTNCIKQWGQTLVLSYRICVRISEPVYLIQHILSLKVSKSQKSNFWYFQFFKKEKNGKKLSWGLLEYIFLLFIRFLEELRIPKIAFEIYWHLKLKSNTLETQT